MADFSFLHGDNVCDFLIASCTSVPSEKGSTPKERICSHGEQILSFSSRPFSVGRQNNFDRFISPESVSIPSNLYCE